MTSRCGVDGCTTEVYPTKDSWEAHVEAVHRVAYVNVNEEGEDYDQHDTVEAALAVQDQFPNDTIEVRRV